MTIKLKCRKAWERLKGGYKIYVSSKKVKIYIPSGNHIDIYGRSMSMSQLVNILCTGKPDMKPRNFPVDAPKHLRHQVYKLLREYTDVLLRNTTNPFNLGEIYADFSTDELSMKVTALVKQWLFDGSYYQATAPNKPKTIQNKGSDVPLVHTGQLVNSITAKIEG